MKRCFLLGLRGGCWLNPASYLRASYRSWDAPSSRNNDLGFRLVRSGQ